MKVQLICVAKTNSTHLNQLIEEYETRLKHYVNYEVLILELSSKQKKKTEEEQKTAEGELILSKIAPEFRLVLLDDKGKSFASEAFAQFLQAEMNKGIKGLAFCIGGPFGFSKEVYAKADLKISLSTMTFTHQMVRLFFTEQLYRGFTILRGEKYHH